MSADPTYGFDLEGERAKYRAAAREVVDGNGFEAIVYEVRGELERDIWVGQRQRPEEHEALEVAGRYVDALVDKALRTHVLKRERQDALPGRLNANMARLDALAEERKDISSEIKRLSRACFRSRCASSRPMSAVGSSSRRRATSRSRPSSPRARARR